MAAERMAVICLRGLAIAAGATRRVGFQRIGPIVYASFLPWHFAPNQTFAMCRVKTSSQYKVLRLTARHRTKRTLSVSDLGPATQRYDRGRRYVQLGVSMILALDRWPFKSYVILMFSAMTP